MTKLSGSTTKSSLLYEMLVDLGVSADDPRIAEMFRALQSTIEELYSYVEPRPR